MMSTEEVTESTFGIYRRCIVDLDVTGLEKCQRSWHEKPRAPPILESSKDAEAFFTKFGFLISLKYPLL